MNFALLDLFGYQFAPRYAQVGKVINDMFDVKEDKEHRIQLCQKANQYPSYCAALGYHPTDCSITKAAENNASHLGEKALKVQAQSPAAGSPDGIQSPGESELSTVLHR